MSSWRSEIRICRCGSEFTPQRYNQKHCTQSCVDVTMKPCRTCGSDFGSRVQGQRYCSDECNPNVHVCIREGCSTRIVEHGSGKLYCSEECRGNSYGISHTTYTYDCKYCSAEFQTNRVAERYCSDECRFELRSCLVCRKLIPIRRSDTTTPGKYCSYKCRSESSEWISLLLSKIGTCRNSIPELSLKPYLEPLGYRSTSEFKWFLTNSERRRTRVPDYVDVENKRVVEVFGEYWHRDQVLPEGRQHETAEECIEWYREIGWDCQVVWCNDLENFKESLLAGSK